MVLMDVEPQPTPTQHRQRSTDPGKQYNNPNLLLTVLHRILLNVCFRIHTASLTPT